MTHNIQVLIGTYSLGTANISLTWNTSLQDDNLINQCYINYSVSLLLTRNIQVLIGTYSLGTANISLTWNTSLQDDNLINQCYINLFSIIVDVT